MIDSLEWKDHTKRINRPYYAPVRDRFSSDAEDILGTTRISLDTTELPENTKEIFIPEGSRVSLLLQHLIAFRRVVLGQVTLLGEIAFRLFSCWGETRK